MVVTTEWAFSLPFFLPDLSPPATAHILSYSTDKSSLFFAFTIVRILIFSSSSLFLTSPESVLSAKTTSGLADMIFFTSGFFSLPTVFISSISSCVHSSERAFINSAYPHAISISATESSRHTILSGFFSNVYPAIFTGYSASGDIYEQLAALSASTPLMMIDSILFIFFFLSFQKFSL